MQYVFFGKSLVISHLNYIRKYHDGSVLYLCSNQQWLEHYYKKSYPSIGAFEQNDALSKEKYILWSGLDEKDPILEDSKNILQIEHGITLTQKTSDGCCYFNFGKPGAQKSLINEYINELTLLEEFTHVFHEKVCGFIKKTKSHKLLLPQPNNIITTQALPEKTRIGLTTREWHCIHWYLQGKNAGEIAEILAISKRTVETHLENIKNKLRCRNLAQMGYLAATLQLEELGYIPHLSHTPLLNSTSPISGRVAQRY